MIARLSSAVFYIITRKLLGAFYVDQKKKDLPPSTLPSEHKQWGALYETQNLTLPIKASLISIVGMHEGTTQQVVTYSAKNNNWVGTNSENYLFYIAICK